MQVYFALTIITGKPRLLLQQIFEECNHEADYCGHQAV